MLQEKWMQHSFCGRERESPKEAPAFIQPETGPSSTASRRAFQGFAFCCCCCFCFSNSQFERPQVTMSETKPTGLCTLPQLLWLREEETAAELKALPWGWEALCVPPAGPERGFLRSATSLALAHRALPLPASGSHLLLSQVDCDTVGMACCFWCMEFRPLRPTAWPNSRRPWFRLSHVNPLLLVSVQRRSPRFGVQ